MRDGFLWKDIPVLHAYLVWQSIEHRSNVKVNVIKNIKATVWAITFERNICFHGNQVPHYKAQGIFQKKKFFISTHNEDIGPKFLPDTYDHTLIL